jgi:hypothetical protein
VRNHIMLLTVAFIVVVTLTGAASAAATNTTTDAYLSGQEVADSAMADANLGLNQSAGNLVITTAGSATVNDQSSEGGAQAVVDTTSSLATGQAITHGSGNLIYLLWL